MTKIAEMNLKIQDLEGKLVMAESDTLDVRSLALLVQDKIFQSGQSMVSGLVDLVVVLV